MTSRIQWVAKAVKRTVNGSLFQAIGVGFAHSDGNGLSLKFDMYPPDDEKQIDIIVRRANAQDTVSESNHPEDRYDLCLVKEHDSGKNKWTKIGWAQQHIDLQGYTLHFNMFRVPQHQIHAGYNLAIRSPRYPTASCRTCGRSCACK
jgi:hypothetical protein